MLLISPQISSQKDQKAMASEFFKPIQKSIFFTHKLKERYVNKIHDCTKNKAILINKCWEEGDLAYQHRYCKKESLIF